ncbi:MAG: AAA family ATPase [Mesorhizobium sp.]|nr:AAA family ATPase [Mesorhizobium sp.]
MNSVTEERVRSLTLAELGINSSEPAKPEDEAETEIAPEEDALLQDVLAALEMGFAGVILAGPPGTGKSWSAKRIAQWIAGDPSAVRIVQFHASYQYEDFMEGFVPREGGDGFELRSKVFSRLCQEAADAPDTTHVLLIDEISRCDVARVFGEALTYLEMDKRGLEFTLSSGRTLIVPSNLIVLATMNPWDKGVDELDIALERRFAQIDVPPSAKALREILERKDVDSAFIDRVVGFFEGVQQLDDEMVHLGHAYFGNCLDEDSARRAWNFRLYPFFKKACRLDKETLAEVRRLWSRSFPDQREAAAPADDGDAPQAPPGEGEET